MTAVQQWEKVFVSDNGTVERLRIFNGWLVSVEKKNLCFVPDKHREWNKKTDLKRYTRKGTWMDKLFIDLDKLGFSDRVLKYLKHAGYHTVGDIVCNKEMVEEDSFNRLLIIPNLGRAAFSEIVTTLSSMGFDKPYPCSKYRIAKAGRK